MATQRGGCGRRGAPTLMDSSTTAWACSVNNYFCIVSVMELVYCVAQVVRLKNLPVGRLESTNLPLSCGRDR